MKWKPFHHPDVSLPVIRRRTAEVLLDQLAEFGELVISQGKSVGRNRSRPDHTARYNAMYRLRKKGLIAERQTGGRNAILKLTPEGEALRSDIFSPQRRWKRPWSGTWYLLTYDVPESDRAYRSVLRAFLKRLGMGCLQGSVWVSPDDIRPEFDDLVKAGGVDEFAFLFEARTVLGMEGSRVAMAAWDFDALQELQFRYCAFAKANLELLKDSAASPEDRLQLAEEALEAYRNAMGHDPLLPQALWPDGYEGKNAFRAHERLMEALRARD